MGKGGYAWGVRRCSHSVPVAHGLKNGVKGSARSPVECSEMSELREMLKLQQEQLTQLTKNVSQLRELLSGIRPVRNDSVICSRCQERGHFARACDGERVPPRPDQTDSRIPDNRRCDRECVFSRPDRTQNWQQHSHQASEK